MAVGRVVQCFKRGDRRRQAGLGAFLSGLDSATYHAFYLVPEWVREDDDREVVVYAKRINVIYNAGCK